MITGEWTSQCLHCCLPASPSGSIWNQKVKGREKPTKQIFLLSAFTKATYSLIMIHIQVRKHCPCLLRTKIYLHTQVSTSPVVHTTVSHDCVLPWSLYSAASFLSHHFLIKSVTLYPVCMSSDTSNWNDWNDYRFWADEAGWANSIELMNSMEVYGIK